MRDHLHHLAELWRRHTAVLAVLFAFTTLVLAVVTLCQAIALLHRGWAFDFGNVPSVFGAIGTVGALWVAVLGVQREARVRREDERRRDDAEKRTEAVGVSFRIDRTSLTDSAVVVENRGKGEISDIELKVFARAEKSARWYGPFGDIYARFPAVPQGNALRIPAAVIIGDDLNKPATDIGEVKLFVTAMGFRDRRGNMWKLDQHGNLDPGAVGKVVPRDVGRHGDNKVVVGFFLFSTKTSKPESICVVLRTRYKLTGIND